MEDAIGKKRVRPSGLQAEPGTGDWIIVAARAPGGFPGLRPMESFEAL